MGKKQISSAYDHLWPSTCLRPMDGDSLFTRYRSKQGLLWNRYSCICALDWMQSGICVAYAKTIQQEITSCWQTYFTYCRVRFVCDFPTLYLCSGRFRCLSLSGRHAFILSECSHLNCVRLPPCKSYREMAVLSAARLAW